MSNKKTYLELNFSLTRDEYMEGMTLHFKQFRAYTLLFVSIVITFLLWTILSKGFTQHNITIAIISLISYAIFYIIIKKLFSWRKKKKLEEICLSQRTFNFNDEGIAVTMDWGNSFLKYSIFQKYLSNGKISLLYMRKNQFYILPLRIFNETQIETLESLCKEHEIEIVAIK